MRLYPIPDISKLVITMRVSAHTAFTGSILKSSDFKFGRYTGVVRWGEKEHNRKPIPSTN